MTLSGGFEVLFEQAEEAGQGEGDFRYVGAEQQHHNHRGETGDEVTHNLCDRCVADTA